MAAEPSRMQKLRDAFLKSDKPQSTDNPKSTTATVAKVTPSKKYSVRNTVTYINEFGKEFQAKVLEAFPMGHVYGKQVAECDEKDIIHHLEYVENGIVKTIRSVHHIDTRPEMADGSQVCVWK